MKKYLYFFKTLLRSIIFSEAVPINPNFYQFLAAKVTLYIHLFVCTTFLQNQGQGWSKGSRVCSSMFQVCFKLTSSMHQICIKFASSMHTVYFKQASNRLQLGFKYEEGIKQTLSIQACLQNASNKFVLFKVCIK